MIRTARLRFQKTQTVLGISLFSHAPNCNISRNQFVSGLASALGRQVFGLALAMDTRQPHIVTAGWF